MNTRIAGIGALLVVVIAAVLVFVRQRDEPHTPSSTQSQDGRTQDGSDRRVLYWYDPMMPQQRFDKPGKSPFMDMQLVPKYADEANGSSVQIAPSAQQSLGMRLARVERSSFGNRVTAVARLELNERALQAVPSRVSGYVERLHVRAVGDPVKQGQLLAQIYSPELLSSQQEFLALRSAPNLSDRANLTTAARQRLRLLGMATSEIEEVERGGQAASRFGVYSPVSGFVMELAAREGGQIQSGAALVAIADLSSLWLIAEVPERDATSLRAGDDIRATLAAGSLEHIDAKIDAIYPTLNTESRTARVRIVVPNEKGHLRPGMLANVEISSSQRESIAVPSEAVIYTGVRSIVIVKEESGFRPAEVQVGTDLGDRTEILQGLREGEEVVASGQFLIDSEASLNGVLARLSQPQTQTPATETPELISSQADVVSIDHANGRVTLSHGPIPQLQWPAMTMQFRPADARVINALAPGDRVRFTLRPKSENGEYVIESITKESTR